MVSELIDNETLAVSLQDGEESFFVTILDNGISRASMVSYYAATVYDIACGT